MTTVLNRTNRGPGTVFSPPADSTLLPNGTITGTGILLAGPLADTTLTVTLGIEGNDTPGAAAGDPGWYTLTASDWRGGATDRSGNLRPPFCSFSSSVVTAARVRGFMDLNKQVSIGLDVTVI